MNSETLISDMSSLTPSSALTSDRIPGHWRVCDYTCDGMDGKLIYADVYAHAPLVTLTLGLKGWHRVVVGVWGELEHCGLCPGGHRLKLSSDPCFRPLVRETPDPTGTRKFETIEETVLCSADLSGNDLVIGPPAPGSKGVTAVAYVRCEPLSPDQVDQIQRERSRTDCRRILAYNDGLAFGGCDRDGLHVDGKDNFREMIEPYRNSDVDSLYWGLLGDVNPFPTKHGHLASGPPVEGFDALNARGINSLTTAMEYAKGIGVNFYVYQRMGAWEDPFPIDVWASPWTKAHPEYRCVSREGVPVSRLSYAYDAVRRHQIDLLSEILSWGADGVDLNFMRGPVYVYYEEPLIEGFKKEFGEDPRTLDEWDEQWLQYRQWPMTAFLRELREELDRVGDKLQKRLAISAVTLPNALGNLYYGLDVETWIKEGLVDRLVPFGLVRGMVEVDLAYYSEMTRGTSTTFWPFLPIYLKDLSYHDLRKVALSYYDMGAQGMGVWDITGQQHLNVTGPILLRMGHIEALRAAVAEGEKDEIPVAKKLDRIGDVDLTNWTAPLTHRERLMGSHYQKHMFMWPS